MQAIQFQSELCLVRPLEKMQGCLPPWLRPHTIAACEPPACVTTPEPNPPAAARSAAAPAAACCPTQPSLSTPSHTQARSLVLLSPDAHAVALKPSWGRPACWAPLLRSPAECAGAVQQV